FGLYTQIWAMHLSFMTLACLWRLLRYGTGFRRTVVLLSVLGLSHLLYAYMMVVSAAVLLVWGLNRSNALARVRRLASDGTLALLAIWLVLYFGRATLGPLAMLLPLQETLLFHRFIGGVHIAAIMLMGVGGAAIFGLLRTRTSLPRTGLAVAAIAIALAPALKDRYTFEETNGIWMRQTQAAIDADAEMRSLR